MVEMVGMTTELAMTATTLRVMVLGGGVGATHGMTVVVIHGLAEVCVVLPNDSPWLARLAARNRGPVFGRSVQN